MSFETEIPKHFIKTYSDNVEYLAQQKGSKLRRAIMEDPDNAKGEGAEAVKQYGATEAEEANDRHGDTPIMSTPRDNRWAYPKKIHWGDLLDRTDIERQLRNPDSDLTRLGMYAMGRGLDRKVIIPAFFGTARAGKDGATAVPFPASSQDVPNSVGTTGFNTAKIREAIKLLELADVDPEMEELFCLIGPQQKEDLLADDKYVNRDYSGQAILPDGRLRPWSGVNFIVVNELPLSGSDRHCPLYARSALRLKRWSDLITKVGERADKQFNVQLYQYQNFGAVRTQEKKVVRVICTEP